MGLTRRSVVVSLALAGIAAYARRDTALAPPSPRRVDVSSAAELATASRLADLCSGQNAVGVGLRGEYFSAENWLGPLALTRIDSVIDFDPTLDWPAGRSASPPRSVRWAGWVKAPIDGRYRFHFDAPGARISVAGQSLAEPGAASGVAVNLHAGRFYPISLELPRVAALQKRISLEWTAPHGVRFIVPQAMLHLPTDTVMAKA